jgi:hypothetical protein
MAPGEMSSSKTNFARQLLSCRANPTACIANHHILSLHLISLAIGIVGNYVPPREILRAANIYTYRDMRMRGLIKFAYMRSSSRRKTAEAAEAPGNGKIKSNIHTVAAIHESKQKGCVCMRICFGC